MKPFKVLLVNCVDPNSEVQTRYPALGLGYLAASLKQNIGDEVRIRIADRDVERILRDDPPSIVGLSTVSQNFGLAARYARAARERGIPAMVGGPHISQLPGTLTPEMDVACIGEGEGTVVALVRHLMDRGGKFDRAALVDIPGVAVRDGDRLVETPAPVPAGTAERFLDALPMPERSLLEVRSHTNMFTSRGCPYRCLFCASTRHWPALRFFSAEYVAEEIRTLVEQYGVSYITFHDDLFIANRPRLEKLVELLGSNGVLSRKVKFSCSAAVTTLSDDTARLLKSMNVVTVAMGLESGNDAVLKYLKGDAFSVEKNGLAVEALRRHGIHAHGSFILGSPAETPETIEDTLRFIRRTPLSIFNIYVLTPLPGTPVWAMAEEAGLVGETMDWSRLAIDFQSNWRQAILLPGNLSREEIYRAYRRLRNLRARRMLASIWTHPFLEEVPRYAVKSVRQIAAQAFRKR